MVNLVRVAPTMAEDDPQIEAARQQVAMAMAAMARPSESGVPIASGAGAVQAKYGIGNALTDLANKLAQGYALGKARQDYAGLQSKQDDELKAAAQQKLNALAPAIAQGGQVPVQTQLAAVPGEAQQFNPSSDLASALAGKAPMAAPPAQDQVSTMTTNAAIPDQINPAHAQLAGALAGMDPRQMNSVLTGLQLRNAIPDPAVVEAQKMREATLANTQATQAASAAEHKSEFEQTNARLDSQAQQAHLDRMATLGAKNKDAAGEELSPDTITNAGWDVLQDPGRMRQYATFGAKGQDIRNKVNNAKTQLMHDAGITEQEVLRQQATAKANIKSVGELVPMRNAISAYETVARNNGDRFLELAKKVNTSGVPLINSAERLGKLASGNADAAEMMQVLQNYQTETARIIANPKLTGQLTDTARKEIENVIPANVTPAQASRIINRLNFEFELRGRGLDDSIAKAQSGLTPGSTVAPPASPAMTQAPPAAIDYLKAHPEAKEAFHAKYGYIPSG